MIAITADCESECDVLAEELDALSALGPDQLRKARADRFYAIGRIA